MQGFIADHREEISALCRRHHVRRLSVFGSAVRDDFDPNHSDVDLHIEFDEDAIEFYADNYFALSDALECLLQRKVDILSAPSIRNPYFRNAVETSQVTLYAG